MSNVYRAPDVKQPRIELVQGPLAEANSTLELAAANVNALLGHGVHYVNRHGTKLNKAEVHAIERDPGQRNPEYWRQPFWFVYEYGERLVAYTEAEMQRSYYTDDRGKEHLRVSFDVLTPKEEMRQMLIAWYAAYEFIGLAEFAAGRGFALKHSRG